MGLVKRISDVDNAQSVKIEYSTNAIGEASFPKKSFNFIFGKQKDKLKSLMPDNPVQFIYKYLNNDVIDNALYGNMNIQNMLNENHLSYKYNLNNVSSIIASHLVPSARTASKIYCNFSRKTDTKEGEYLVQAALLHDIGKIFIPDKILNKTGKLNSKERQIVELHNKFSYEILKTTLLKPQVARLALEHHNYDNCFKRNTLNQILMIADIYCALREVRPYKKALSDLSAKTILYDMGTKGMFDAGYIKYLW